MWRAFSTVPSYASQFFDLPFTEKEKDRPKVVVVGSGWASESFVRNLNSSLYTVQVISERPNRLNQPHMISLWKPTYTPFPVPVTLDTCTSVDLSKKQVLGKKNTYAYDYLVVATGSVPNDFGIPGVKEHCLTCKTDTDLTQIQSSLQGVEPATILGAGPTGIELACKLSSLGHPVSLIEASATVLPGFSPAFQTTVLRLLSEKGIRMRLNQKITGMTATHIRTQDGEIPDTAFRIWTCGVRPVSLSLGKADEYQQVGSAVFAIGDCAGRPTAQSARQQGAYVASYFNAGFPDTKKPFVYSELGRIVDLEDQFVVELYGTVFVVPGFVRPLVHFMTR